MTAMRLARLEATRSATAVRTMLRDIGYVLWISRGIAAEIRSEATAERRPHRRPDMADFCACDAAGFAA